MANNRADIYFQGCAILEEKNWEKSTSESQHHSCQKLLKAAASFLKSMQKSSAPATWTQEKWGYFKEFCSCTEAPFGDWTQNPAQPYSIHVEETCIGKHN